MSEERAANQKLNRNGRWVERLALILVLPMLVACGSLSDASRPSAQVAQPGGQPKLRAITTMSLLSDMVGQVGGERVDVQNIIPIGAGPEDYQPTPQDAQAIGEADIVFYNGHGLEQWLDKLFGSAGRPDQPRIAVSDGLEAVDAGAEFAEGNPHFWLSAAFGAKYVEKIRDGLIQLDPNGAAIYRQRADSYITQLGQLNNELKQQAASIPAERRLIVTNHDAFPYFAREYGFTIVGNLLGSAETDLSAGDMAQLIQQIEQQHVSAIFAESQFSPRLTQALADEAGVEVIATLYTDTLGEPGSGVETYADMLRYNMRTIVEALKE
ncbi:MAG TPA: metal ABC transporter substrate-binding protein [Roseiflexaceae bacterium]|nr:metal ABC transporter substrate-binding protein [Roseiflexaceae bacterium]